MFGGKDKPKSTINTSPQNGRAGTAAQAGAAGLNSLVKGTVIEGKVKAASDIRVEGELNGDLDCQAKVIIGPSGVVKGTVTCRTAMIEGHFDGNLRVTDLLEVRDNAKVEGEIHYGQLKIDAGAILLGNMKMTDAKANAHANGGGGTSVSGTSVSGSSVSSSSNGTAPTGKPAPATA